MRSGSSVAGVLVLLFSTITPATRAQPVTARITVDATAPRTQVSPELYGIFFEEISHAGEGGLNAELVQNRDFEATNLPAGWKVDGRTLTTPLGWKTEVWFTDELTAWSLVKDGDADGSIVKDDSKPLTPRNPHSVRLTASKLGTRLGLANAGFWGMNVQDQHSYDGSFYARTESGPLGLTFSLESTDGKTVYAKATVAGVGSTGDWKKYSYTLQAKGNDPKARLVISPDKATTLWLDCVSLVPSVTFKGHGMRMDLAQMLVDMKPAFIRFPGGCIVEGATLHNRIRWEDSVGDISQRTGDFGLWGYYNHYSMGYHEFLQLCEDLGSEAMYVINAGMSCQLRRPYELARDEDLHLYIEDSLNALEYAMGPMTSKYGAMRAANGHPQPFKIKYVEIGNENWASNYEQHHYRAFYEAIKAKYPQIITIADTRIPLQPIEVVDDHFYVPPQRFFELSNLYDAADRKGPKIYVGEYAVNRDVGTGNLLGALAEAVFTMMMERNSDLVAMCSYAPLFENVNRADWPVNLIRFDSSRVIGRSSYYMQTMFANNRPDMVLKTEVQSGKHQLVTSQVQDLYATCGVDRKAGEVILKIVNSTPGKITASVSLKGLVAVGGEAKVTTLSNVNSLVDNTLENPKAVIPVTSSLKVGGPDFSYEFAANSLTLMRIPCTDK